MDISQIIIDDITLSDIDISALTNDIGGIDENEAIAIEEKKPLAAQIIDVKIVQPPKVTKPPAPVLNAVPTTCTYSE